MRWAGFAGGTDFESGTDIGRELRSGAKCQDKGSLRRAM
jgi:hypothetical protein